MNSLAALGEELDRWADAGTQAAFWWRDDDATRAGPALDRLLALVEDTGGPLALAVIPEGCRQDLAQRLEAVPSVRVLQHGYAHRNHEPAGYKKCELGDARPYEAVAAELSNGRNRLKALFGDSFLPVLVPPWNRIASTLLPRLPELGFRGLSTYGVCKGREAAPGLLQVNCHLDPIDWHGSRGFSGGAAALAPLLQHLNARREGTVDVEETSGILSHHAAQDEETWTFLGQLLSLLTRHPGARLDSARQVFEIDAENANDLSISA